ncbi:methyltransferase domain-containing protein [Pseudoprimorskyibacter insulae]|uniref:Trans-aconitate 2-methyltransferase n=1 Tax=Pseudoprimorskyibacter insulae TaxID=1695997 RepID=A0A2R8AVP2_9RHOB|nr:methyltransferase domain-containing protein [Pseudoprimorskyibacter insulae]SPF79984.1 Trans-aconitate 2-methyltransferase [Pseudoprimorskyibacter insulae]
MSDWDPELYSRFAGPRLRPALDLIRALPALPAGDVVDLGCGNGAVGPALRQLGRRLIGVDNSASMLGAAQDTGAYDRLELADIATWQPEDKPALIFSNAALHWLGDHDGLLPRLAGLLAPGGVLAVQVPNQNDAPSHQLWYDLATGMFPGRVSQDASPGILTPEAYHTLLTPLGALDLWQTRYFQVLPGGGDGHPVRRFTQSTFAKPVLDQLTPTEESEIISAYEDRIEAEYSKDAKGAVLFPFRRLFFILKCSVK